MRLKINVIFLTFVYKIYFQKNIFFLKGRITREKGNKMSMYTSFPPQNIVRDYDQSQGTTHPTDLSYQILRDYHIRYITVQNSAVRPIGVAITLYLSGPTPPILFTLAAGEIRHLGINTQGGPPQFIWLLDVQTSMPTGGSTILRSDANDFVIRDGLNKQWVQSFRRPSYSAAH
jgi:hypothetical protein